MGTRCLACLKGYDVSGDLNPRWGVGVYAKEFGRRWDSWRGLRCESVQCFLKMISPWSSLVPFT